MYANETTPPTAPTIAATPVTGAAGSSITISDATGNTGYWWGNTVQAVQASALGTTPTAAPATCGAGGGYGNVPTAFLAVNWFATGSTTPIVGSASGVTISNDCYDGTTLHTPLLGGTIPVPATVTAGTNYTVFLCELNATPFPSNDAHATTDCGTAPAGASWIDASFAFGSAAASITQASPTTGVTTAATSAAFTSQLVVTGATGAVTYVQTTGNSSVVVSSTGAVKTTGALKAGVYTATGTTSDANGDKGTFTFALSVGVLTQTSPATATVATTGSSTYTSQLAVSGANGVVAYAQTAGTPALVVSATGVVTTSGALAAGVYTATGTTSDPNGDAGTYSLALTVTAPVAPAGPHATRTIGHVTQGRTMNLTVAGSGFYGRPSVTSHAGTTVSVIHDYGNSIVVRVTVRAGSRNGVFTFTIVNANGQSCKVKYVQRA
jgi:hypothetical protein